MNARKFYYFYNLIIYHEIGPISNSGLNHQGFRHFEQLRMIQKFLEKSLRVGPEIKSLGNHNIL